MVIGCVNWMENRKPDHCRRTVGGGFKFGRERDFYSSVPGGRKNFWEVSYNGSQWIQIGTRQVCDVEKEPAAAFSPLPDVRRMRMREH